MIKLTDYGFLPNMITEGSTGIPARVTAVHKDRYALICEHGEVNAILKTKEYYVDEQDFPTVGDFVLINYLDDSESQIIKTLERKTYFSRREPGPIPRDQAVAANFDYVFIMQSLNFDFNIRRLERYITLAWQSGAIPVVVLTKADLVEDYSKQMREVEKIATGVGVYAVSAKTGFGMDTLSEYLKARKTIVLLGSSGVGKSSFTNALAGNELMLVNDIREDDSKGRHTTTHRQLFMLDSGVMMIDTPGMRQLGMWDVSQGLGESFADVEQYFGLCKFSDCMHQSEPGCAIKIAIENGELAKERWESYNNLKEEAQYSDDKAAYLRKKQQWHKDIAKWQKQKKKLGGHKIGFDG